MTNADGATVDDINPFRCRGYYYDAETGLYYLGSRYYDPGMKRFISPDTEDVLTATVEHTNHDKNLFSYCDNNPVVRKDAEGEFWHLLIGAAVGVAAQYASDVAINLHRGETFSEALKPKSTWADYGAAALSGGLAVTGVGLGASIVANAAIGGTTYLANCGIKGKKANIVDLGFSIGIGATSGLIGGRGANGKSLIGITKTSRQVLRTAVSPKKIVMYNAKIELCKRVAIESGLRTMTAGISGNYLSLKRRQLTRSVV